MCPGFEAIFSLAGIRVRFVVAAMVVLGLICVIGSAAAAAVAETTVESSLAEIIGVALFLGAVATGLVVYIRWKAKKSDPLFPIRSVKALNAAIVHRMTVVNATYTRDVIEVVATSPKVLTRAYGTNLYHG